MGVPRVAVFTLGGTIAMQARAGEGVTPALSAADLVATVPGLDDASVDDAWFDLPDGLRATKPGKHPINGLFRVGYIHGADELAMVSVPLIANVTGAE